MRITMHKLSAGNYLDWAGLRSQIPVFYLNIDLGFDLQDTYTPAALSTEPKPS